MATAAEVDGRVLLSEDGQPMNKACTDTHIGLMPIHCATRVGAQWFVWCLLEHGVFVDTHAEVESSIDSPPKGTATTGSLFVRLGTSSLHGLR